MYLTRDESLPGDETARENARYSVPPFGIDVFKGVLRGLFLAEAEFNSAEEIRTDTSILHRP